MKNEKLYDGVTGIRDDLVEKAGKTRRRSKKMWWSGAVAALLALAIFGGLMLRPETSPVFTAQALATPTYPVMAQYPDESQYFNSTTQDSDGFSKAFDAWRQGLAAQARNTGYQEGLEDFLTRSAEEFLTAKPGENLVYSPLNVYMALAMLAETTDGESRSQILTLLGSGSLDALRSQAGDLWNDNYRQDGATTSVLASSLWLDRDISYKQDAMNALAEHYYAASFQGEMGSSEYNQLLQSWLNEQTGGLLEEQASQIEMDPETVLALAATIYFKSKWSDEFGESRTEPGVFHAASGDVTADFMHQSQPQNYYWAESFSAIARSLESGGQMWLILPDEGVSPETLLQDGDAMAFLLKNGDWENRKHLTVNQSIPKFDVTSQLDLKQGLQNLGITEVFGENADFSPMLENADGVSLSRIQHDARVTIDEEGVTAAAYTVMMMAGATMPPADEVDFTLDRPFVFAITGRSGLPLFLGVVNTPM